MIMAAARMPAWRRLARRPWFRFAARRERRPPPMTEATSRYETHASNDFGDPVAGDLARFQGALGVGGALQASVWA